MSIRPTPELIDCPSCGVKNAAIEERCVACGTALAFYIGPRPKVRRISLRAIMMLIVVVAICLAPVRVAPELSVIISLVAVPTALRTYLSVAEREADRRPMRSDEKLDALFGSLGVSVAILAAVSIAFGATCSTVGCVTSSALRSPFPANIVPALLAGGVAAAYALYRMLRWLWPRKD